MTAAATHSGRSRSALAKSGDSTRQAKPKSGGGHVIAVNPWIIAMTVTIATFMEVLDTSVANVAVPYIAGGTASSYDQATWVLTSYLVSNAVILPMSAWISRVIGRKRFYMSCVALFTFSSFLCGIAPNLPMLVVFRVLQGIGGGGLQPSEQAILADTFEPAKRGMAFAVYGMAVVAAPALGPTLGGYITYNWHWRWIFFINIPFGILSLVLTHFLIQDPPNERSQGIKGKRVDYVGFSLIAMGLGCLQVVLDRGQEDDWFGSNFITTMFCLCVLGIVGGVIWEWFIVRDPIVDLKLLKERNFAISTILMFALGVALFGSTVVIPQFLQELLGYTPEQAGLAISPGGVWIIILLPIIGRMLGKFSGKWIIAFGFFIAGVGLMRMTNWDLNVSYSRAALDRVVQATGIACLFVPINTVAYAYLPKSKNNAGSALVNLSRNIGASVGISYAQTMILRRSQFHQARLVGHVNAGNPAYRAMVSQLGNTFAGGTSGGGSGHATGMAQAIARVGQLVQRQAQVLSFIDIFKAFAVACFVSIPLAFLLKKNDPGKGAAAH